MLAKLWTGRRLRTRVLVVLLALAGAAILAPRIVDAAMPIKYWIVWGYKLQVRGDVPHRFGACVPQPVSHFHIEIFEPATRPGRWKYLSNFHLGTYRQGKKCYVVWNNHRPSICAKTCNRSKTQLRTSIRDAIVSIGVAVGITISLAVAMAMARVLVPLIW